MNRRNQLIELIKADGNYKLFSQSDGRVNRYKISPHWSLNYSDVYYFCGNLSEVIAWYKGCQHVKQAQKIVSW